MDERLHRFLELLGASTSGVAGTSIRLPVELRRAAALAAELGYGDSTTDLTTQGLRRLLEDIAQRAVLEAHYHEFPDARPTLAGVAIAMAELDGNPLADRFDVIERAARDVQEIREAATPDDVLIYAAGLVAAA